MRYTGVYTSILAGPATGLLLSLSMVGCALDDGAEDDLAEEDASELLDSSSASAPEQATRPGCEDFFQGNIFISVLRPGFALPTASDRKVIGIDRAGTRNRDRAILANYDPNAPNQRWSFRQCYFDGGIYAHRRDRRRAPPRSARPRSTSSSTWAAPWTGCSPSSSSWTSMHSRGASRRTFTDDELTEIRTHQQRAYRWTFLVSGLQHPTFVRIVGQLTTGGQDKIAAAAQALAA